MIEAEAVQEAVWSREVEASSGPGPALTETPGPVRIDYVVDFYHRYPGELLTFYTRLRLLEPLADLTLRVVLPPQLVLEEYQAPPERAGLMPGIEVDDGVQYLVWTLAGDQPAGTSCEFQTIVRVAPQLRDVRLESQAVVTRADYAIVAEESVAVLIQTKGAYLSHLPELYGEDEFMARFLMLFESFWAPISTQISTIHHYFDPRLTPAPLLPWLASWLDLALDERWSVERQRQLVRWAIALHRSRGTKWGLQRYLEIYTGQKARIVEHRAKNFQLGGGARLGRGVALGKNNQPHTFTVHLRLPALEHIADETERARQEQLRRRTIESIIGMQKPAHTVYTLNLEVVPAAELDAPAPPAEVPAPAPPEVEDELTAEARTWFQLGE